MHSDSFLGTEFSDELYHWKYIKKKKINGKWRYYYDKTANELTMLEQDLKKAQKALDVDFNEYYRHRYRQDLGEANANIRSNPKGPKNVKNWYSDPRIKSGTKETYQQGRWLRSDVHDANNRYLRRERSIGGKIDAFMEKHGRTFAKKLNNVNDRIEKGKNWIKQKFS